MQRLVKDFVGARLEAEETLRKQRAAALVDNAVDHLGTVPTRESASGEDEKGEEEKEEEEEEQRWQETTPVRLSALRQRERELHSKVAVLDDRMVRARPMGLLATARAASSTASVSVSVLVSDSSPAMLGTGQDPRSNLGSSTARFGAFGPATLGNFSAASSVTLTATPGRYRHRQRRRRNSVPLLLPLDFEDARRDGVKGSGDRGRRRPWTTSHAGGATEDMALWEQDVGGGRKEGDIEVKPFRYDHEVGEGG